MAMCAGTFRERPDEAAAFGLLASIVVDLECVTIGRRDPQVMARALIEVFSL